jgi:hypothetical protein
MPTGRRHLAPGALCWLRLYSAHIGIALGHEDLVDHDDPRRDPTTIPGAQPRQSVVDREGSGHGTEETIN